MYKIHFGVSSTSKFYPQLMELSRLADSISPSGDSTDNGYVVCLRDDQTELMASVYLLAIKMPFPRLRGADIRSMYVCCLGKGAYRYRYASEKKQRKIQEVV